MIAYIDVCFILIQVFLTSNLVRNEIEFAEGPGPKLKKFKANGCRFITESKWDKNARKINKHEYWKYDKYPNQVEFQENFTDQFQRELLTVIWIALSD